MRYPKAQWRPLAADETYQGLMTRHDGIVLHTAVGTLAGTDAYFMLGGYTGTESHFMVGPDGESHQYTDTARRADANLDANYRLLSIETADSGPPFPAWTGGNVPPWTEAQLDAIAGIIAWAARTHNFPVRLMESSRSTERGIGWHRQGIDGNFPTGLLAGRVADGERYSTTTGKVCPGDNRIRQIPTEILPRVQAILGGSTQGDSDMQLSDPIPGTDKKVGDALRAALRMADALSVVRANILERDKATAAALSKVQSAVAALPEGATKAEVRDLLDHLDATIQLKVVDQAVTA